jgi:hypothetical protein
MPRRSYLIEQASKARRLAADIACPRTSGDLEAYATGCDQERRVLDRHARLDWQQHEERKDEGQRYG